MAAKVLQSSYTGSRNIARITTRTNVKTLKDMDTGFTINYAGYVLQEITNERTGEVFNAILIADQTGEIFATRSETFIRGFFEILEICAMDESDEPIMLMLTKQKSNAGREFISCALT